MGHVEQHRPGPVVTLIPLSTAGVAMAQYCNAPLWHPERVHHNILDDVFFLRRVVHRGRMSWPIREALCLVHKLSLSGWLSSVAWLWRCAALVGIASVNPRHRNSIGNNIGICQSVLKDMVPKIALIGVVDLAICL